MLARLTVAFVVLALVLGTAAFVTDGPIPWPTASTPGGVLASDCGAGNMVRGIKADGTLNCVAAPTGGGLATGSIIFVDSGTCPAGFTEETTLNGRTLEFTLAANADVGTTGGADSVTPAGSVAVSAGPSATTTFKAASSGTNTTVASSTHTHAAGSFSGAAFDNRSAFIKVIGCKAN